MEKDADGFYTAPAAAPPPDPTPVDASNSDTTKPSDATAGMFHPNYTYGAQMHELYSQQQKQQHLRKRLRIRILSSLPLTSMWVPPAGLVALDP